MTKIRRALLSVSDKTGVADLARQLHELGVELLSTGGTAGQLRQAGLPVREVARYTRRSTRRCTAACSAGAGRTTR
jgi:phosphoribosylaminoimidazolecarboxamide formyltransferase/IMP cyclohydrolase